jgi:hypothetical protein
MTNGKGVAALWSPVHRGHLSGSAIVLAVKGSTNRDIFLQDTQSDILSASRPDSPLHRFELRI